MVDADMTRRHFLKAGSALVTGVFLSPALGLASDFWSQPRHLWLRRQTARNTVEEFKGVYFADGQIIWDEYLKICLLLRDVRQGEAVQMSPVLLDILCGMQGVLGANGIDNSPLITHSGYRSGRTNQLTEGAARDSLHTMGRAWDGRTLGAPTPQLAQTAKYLRGGGVGVYVERGFIHVDDGRLRSWRG
jgi:uncharacterized protein YcbK (DUF882 family)